METKGIVGFQELIRKPGENHGEPESCFELVHVVGRQETAGQE